MGLGYGMPDEHELNMKMTRMREQTVEHVKKSVEECLEIYGDRDMADRIATMFRHRFDAFCMAGFTKDQAMQLLLHSKESLK